MPEISKSPQQTAFQQKITPYGSRGLVLKKDAALLEDGQYSELTNIVSIQEGQLTQRPGQRRLTGNSSWDTGQPNLVYSIGNLHASTTKDYYYAGAVGDFGDIFRAVGPIPQTGASLTLERVAVNTSAVGSTGQPYETMRWSSVRYAAGSIGTPYIFFACPQKMLKDNGTLESGDGSGDGTTKIQRWGIIPPTYPITAALDAITILPATEVVTGSGRINTTISSFTGTGPGLITITPASMVGIIDGMLVNINSGQLGIVELAGPGSFTVYLATTPANGQTITSGQATAVPGAAPGTVTQYTLGSTLDASFNGIAQDGFDTDDIVHVAIGIADPVNISDIRLRVMVNNATGVDYYEKEILPSQVQLQASVTDTATATLPPVSQNVDTGVLGPYNILDDTANRAKPVLLNQVPPNQNVAVPVWTELDIPKNQFLKVGLAGTGLYTWKNIKGFQVVSVGTAADIWIGSLYIAGGFGPNALSNTANVPLLPYDYLATFRNPITGLESNPSPFMIPNNFVTPLRQAVKLSLISSADNQVSGMPTANTDKTNNSAIAVYRRGGAFADGLYRLVGYATNHVDGSGGPLTVTFVDKQSDASLISAPIISFDNDPPVRSTLPVPFLASWVSYTVGTGAPGYSRFTMSVISAPDPTDLTTFLRVGSVITIAPNTEVQEVCAVVAVTATTIDTIFQYDHTAPGSDVFVRCDSVVGQPCTLSLAAFDSIFLAGDKNNPHVLYKSKTGRPEIFPVVELDTGIAMQINVGTPANPIMNLTEYNGQILVMNLDCIFVVQVFLGQMQAPLRTAATRGLYASYAWCKVENEIWYLAYDGIYSWAGGESVKRSEAIDPIFHGISVGPYAAIDLNSVGSASDPVFTNAPESPKDFIVMFYSKQRVYVIYRDINYAFHRLRYDILYDRWTVENLGEAQTGLTIPTAAFITEEAGFSYDHAGNFVAGSNIITANCIIDSGHSPTAAAYLYMDDVGSSDGWVNLPTDGAPIAYSFQPAAYTFGAPSFEKQYSDCISELNNDAGLVQIQTYYNFSPVPDSLDFFTIPVPSTSQGRKRSIFSFQRGYGKEAYALQFRYSGTTTGNVTFYSNTFNYFSLDQLQIGRAFDWDDLGTPDDKRLYEVSFWYDAKNAPHTWVLDTITGVVNNQTVTEDVQEFILEPLNGTFTGPTWTQVTFPINDNILTAEGIPNSIVKKVRLRPKQPGATGAICVLDSVNKSGVRGQYGMQNWGIYKVGANYYRALFDGFTPNRLFILKSTDQGATWINFTGSKVINGGGAPATGIAVTFGAGIVYVLYAAAGSANPRAMTVSRFDTSSDTWLSDITGLPTMSTTATTSGFGATNMSIAVKPNGKLEIIYNGATQTISGSTYARVYWSEYTGSWSAGVAITGQTGVAKDFLSSQILVSSTNRAHIILQTLYPAAFGYDIYHVSIPDAGSQQTFQLVTSDASTRVRDFPTSIGLGLAYLDALNVNRIAIPYIPGGNSSDGSPDFGPAFGGKIIRSVDANNPVWTIETVETSTQITGFQLAFEVLTSLAYDISSDSLYALWVSPSSYGVPTGSSEVVSTSGRVMYSVNSGAGWAAPVVVDTFLVPIAPSGVTGSFFGPGILTTLIYAIDSTAFFM